MSYVVLAYRLSVVIFFSFQKTIPHLSILVCLNTMWIYNGPVIFITSACLVIYFQKRFYPTSFKHDC